MEKTVIEVLNVKCERCGHSWLYTKGEPKYRIRCPRCRSARNSINLELFGRWKPYGN